MAEVEASQRRGRGAGRVTGVLARREEEGIPGQGKRECVQRSRPGGM